MSERTTPDIWQRIHRNELLPVCGILLVLLFVFFFKVIFLGYNLWAADLLYHFLPWKNHAPYPGYLPHNEAAIDVISLGYPWLTFSIRAISAGELPLWNPYIFCGTPHLANYRSGVLYPPDLLYYVLPIDIAILFNTMLRLFLAGLFTYLFLRRLRVSRLGATISAVAFTFNGFFISWLEYPLVSIAMWMPALFLLVHRLFERGGVWTFVLLALVATMIVLGGHPATSFHVLFAVTLYCATRFLHGIISRREPGEVWKLTLFAGALLISVGLAALQIIPFWEYLRHSAVLEVRSGVLSGTFHLGKQYILTGFLPGFFGSHIDYNYWGNLGFTETNYYVGILTLVLALLAVFYRRTRHVLFFLGLLIISGSVVYGIQPIHYLITHLFPFSIINNIRMTLLMAFSICVMAGFGSDALWQIRAVSGNHRKRALGIAVLLFGLCLILLGAVALGLVHKEASVIHATKMATVSSSLLRFIIFFALASVCVYLYVSRRLGRVQFLSASILVLALDVFPFGITYTQHPSFGKTFPEEEVIEFLRKESGHKRILSSKEVLPPDTPMYYGIFDVKGKDDLEISDYHRLFPELGGPLLPTMDDSVDLDSPLFDLVGVGYVLWESDVSAEDLTLIAQIGDLKVYRNEAALDRCFIVSEVETVKDREVMLRRLKEGDIDLRHTVFLDEEVDFQCQPLQEPASCEIVEYTNNRVCIEAQLQQDGFLFLSDAYFPGWQAYVDGIEEKIYRANYAFRAVHLPPGHHRVEFVYRPRSFFLGCIVSLGTAAVLSAIVLLSLVIKRLSSKP